MAKRKRIPQPRSYRRLTRADIEVAKQRFIRGESIRCIARSLGCAEITLYKYSSEQNWSRQRVEKYDATVKEIRAQFEDEDYGHQRLIRDIANGAKGTHMLTTINEIIYIKMLRRDGTTFKRPQSIQKTISTIDNQATFKYRQMAAQMMEMFPVPRQPIAPSRHGNKGQIMEWIENLKQNKTKPLKTSIKS